MKIILVEDDNALALGVIYALKAEGYEVCHSTNVKDAIKSIEENKNSDEELMALFDVMLPDGTGYDLIQYVKDNDIYLPIIVLTAMAEEVNIIQGLDMGADDYIAKPFRVRELMSRIKAVSRRYYGADIKKNENIIRYRSLLIDINAACVYSIKDGEKRLIELTSNEYRLLLYFIKNQGIALTRATILSNIFNGYSDFVDDNTLSVYIKRLREKIEDNDKENPYIKTIRGIGYMLEKNEEK